MAAVGAAGGPGGAGPAPPGVGAGAAAGAAAPAPSALTPALVRDAFLNYTLTNNMLYYKAIKGLTNKFNLAPANMRKFLQDIFNKAQDVNWLMTFSIPVGNDHYDLIKEYGSVMLEDMALFAATYVGTKTRHAQNSNQVYACLSESLTPEAQNKVALETKKYTINGVLDGICYFKVIVGLAHIDTLATVATIRISLTSLDSKIAEFQDNIVALYTFVKTQTDGLEAGGEKSNNLLTNLFKGYKKCSGKEFVNWVQSKQDSYYEKQIMLNPKKPMSLAKDKYMTQIKDGMWMLKMTSQKRIVALTAQVASLEKGWQHVKKPDPKKPFVNNTKIPKNKGAPPKNRAKGKDWAWALIGPKEGQPKEKTVKGKPFCWCTYHDENGSGGKWVQHSLQDCKIRQEIEAKKKADGSKLAVQMKVTGMVAILPVRQQFLKGRSELELKVPSLQTTNFILCTLACCCVPHGGMLQKSAHARWVVVDRCVLWHRSGGDKHSQGLGQAMQNGKEEALIQRELLLLLCQGQLSTTTIQARQPQNESNWAKRGEPPHQSPNNQATKVPSNNLHWKRRLPGVDGETGHCVSSRARMV
jgi:hypothetical protein